MSWRKRQLQRLGSWVVRQVSNTTVPDTTSGFRAYTREAALRMTIVSEFSYTLESIIQAGKKRMAIAHVPIAVNPRTRESRLFDSIFSYIKRSGATIVRIYAMYEPLKVFTYLGLTIVGAGFLLGAALPATTCCASRASGTRARSIASAVLMIVGFLVLRHRPARRRHLGQPQAARGSALPRAHARAAAARAGARAPGAHARDRPRRSVGALIGGSVQRLHRHSGVQRERVDRRRRRGPARRGAVARDHRRRRRVDRRHGRARGRGRRDASCAIPTTWATAPR